MSRILLFPPNKSPHRPIFNCNWELLYYFLPLTSASLLLILHVPKFTCLIYLRINLLLFLHVFLHVFPHIHLLIYLFVYLFALACVLSSFPHSIIWIYFQSSILLLVISSFYLLNLLNFFLALKKQFSNLKKENTRRCFPFDTKIECRNINQDWCCRQVPQ